MRLHLPLSTAAAALAVVLAGCGGAETVTVTVGSDGEAPELEAAPQQNPSEGTTTESSGGVVTQRAVGGKPAKDGSVTYRVASVRAVGSIPAKNEYSSAVTPQRNTTLWAIRVSARNDGKTGVTPFCGGTGVVAIDQDGRNFDIDTSGALEVSNDFCTEIQPGFRGSYLLPVRTPKGARIVAVGTWDSDDANDFSGDTSWIRWTVGS